MSVPAWYIDSSPREPRFVLVPRAGLGKPWSDSNATNLLHHGLKQSPQKWSKHGCAKGTLTVLATGLEKRFQCECTQDYAPLNQVNYSMTERCSYKFARFYCRAIAPYIHHKFTTYSPYIHHIFTTYSPYFHHIYQNTLTMNDHN